MDPVEQTQTTSQSIDEDNTDKKVQAVPKTDEEKCVHKSSDGLSVQTEVSGDKDDDDILFSDFNDALSFGQTKPILERVTATMPVDSRSCEYNMKHKKRGFAVIISYSKFDLNGPPRRDCAEHDARICKEAFKKLNYDVRAFENLGKRDFLDLLRKVREIDHSDCDSLVIIFMSHGGVNERTNKEFLWTYDAQVNTSELWKSFTPEKCPSLAGKPKLFFIQACRGEDTDKGVKLRKSKGLMVQTDSVNLSKSREEDYAIPLYADMLMMWASYPGMFAFKSRNNGMGGSVFLHFLAKVIKEEGKKEDLMSMLISVTREVAIHYESHVPGDRELHQNKQIPQLVSTLMRKINFV